MDIIIRQPSTNNASSAMQLCIYSKYLNNVLHCPTTYLVCLRLHAHLMRPCIYQERNNKSLILQFKIERTLGLGT